jgi:predicted kinase
VTGLEAVVPAPGAAVDERAIRAFLAGFVDADALAATPQDASFHAEGDVWIHTLQVVDALVALPAWRALDPTARAITFAASLLHDVGKPSTTRHEPDGKISSRGHSARGDTLVRGWLWRRGVPFGVREHVCALIRHHQVPFFGITRPPLDAARTAARLSLRLRHDWLALVAEADARGRRCADPADQARMLDHTALWVEHCRELGVLDRPHAFASDHTRAVYFEADDAHPRAADVVAYDDTVATVTVMSGLPASGKDTWLRGVDVPVVSLDALRVDLDVEPDDAQGPVIAAARDAARDHLRAGRSFAWNATNLSSKLRGGVIALMRGYRAKVRVVYCEASAADQHARNRRRPSPVPARVIDDLLMRWTVPGRDEAHEVVYVVEDDGPVPWPPL